MVDPHAPEPLDYEIRLRGHLDERWREFFPDFALTHDISSDGTPLTSLRGRVTDDAALHGLLARIRDLGIPLLLVERVSEGATDEGTGSTERRDES